MITTTTTIQILILIILIIFIGIVRTINKRINIKSGGNTDSKETKEPKNIIS
ncbi:MAG: hypothetical protein KA792_06805 [Bacteroidales bacterium]|nr:hypothetical protein [Bacteroidales bacterium]